MPQQPDRWESIVASSGLGLPVPPGTSHRLLRRVVAKLCAPFLAEQVRFNQGLLEELVAVRDSLAREVGDARWGAAQAAQAAQELAQGLQQVQAQLEALAKVVEQHGYAVDAALPVLEKHGYAIDAALPTLEKHGYAIDAIAEKIEDFTVDRDLVHQELELAQQQSFARVHDGLGMVRTELAELGRALDDQGRGRERLQRELDEGLTDLRWRFAQVDLLVDVVRRSLPEPPEQEELAALPHPIENLYGSLEQVMRGSHEVIVERVQPYLEDVRSVSSQAPVLDVGCGRGEWLEVLKGAGIEAYGVEVTTIYRDIWQQSGLDVRIEDVRDHLAKLEEGSLRAISAFHVVEHLATDDLVELLGLALRALVPGGLLLLETPSPENLLVGSWSFYLDPTHRKPIPARLLAFYVGSRGFAEVQTRYLPRPELPLLAHPAPGKPWERDLEPVIDAVNRHLFAPQDYAILARRA